MPQDCAAALCGRTVPQHCAAAPLGAPPAASSSRSDRSESEHISERPSSSGVEATIIHHFNTYTSITATKAKPFPDGKQADILLSNITTIDTPAARNLSLDVTSTNPMGVTNQGFINRAALNHQPVPDEHDPRNDVLTSAKRAEEAKHLKYDANCTGTGSHFLVSRSRRRAGTPTGGRFRVQAQEGHLVCAPPETIAQSTCA